MAKEKIEWIDAAKGFTMLLVILGHCFDGYISAGMFQEHLSWLKNSHAFIYSFHMPLFFIMSGYLFYHSYSDYSFSKLKNKVIDIILLYFMFSVVQIAIQTLMAGKINRQVSFVDILYLPVYTVPPYWYLYVLGALYILSNLFFKKMTINRLVLALIICVASTVFIQIREFSISWIGYYLFFFLLGGGIAFTSDRLQKVEFSYITSNYYL